MSVPTSQFFQTFLEEFLISFHRNLYFNAILGNLGLTILNGCSINFCEYSSIFVVNEEGTLIICWNYV
jgi:hypothetical protein